MSVLIYTLDSLQCMMFMDQEEARVHSPRADQPSNKHSAKLTPDLSVQKLTCVHRAHIESLGGE